MRHMPAIGWKKLHQDHFMEIVFYTSDLWNYIKIGWDFYSHISDIKMLMNELNNQN
jgi:hypothetical protein